MRTICCLLALAALTATAAAADASRTSVTGTTMASNPPAGGKRLLVADHPRRG